MKSNKLSCLNTIIDNIKIKIIQLEALPLDEKILYTDVERHLEMSKTSLKNYKSREKIPFNAILEWCNKQSINTNDIFFSKSVTYCTNDSCNAIINDENIVYNKKNGKYIRIGKCKECVNTYARKKYREKLAIKFNIMKTEKINPIVKIEKKSVINIIIDDKNPVETTHEKMRKVFENQKIRESQTLNNGNNKLMCLGEQQ